MTKKINYLNNRDMLEEIHKSKSSYCEFTDEKYSRFDLILDSVEEIFDPENIKLAKEQRAENLAYQSYQKALTEFRDGKISKRPKAAEFAVDPDSISTTDLVFRVYTYSHIPLEPGRKKNPKKEADNHAKVNFPPFMHYIINDEATKDAKEVGRSHWKNGEFSVDHGAMTRKLAYMFLLLTDRYGQSANWRGYCVDEETEALTQRGWLNIDEITEEDIILSYNKGNLQWSKINSIFRSEYDGLMHKLTNQTMNSLVTPNHKILTERGLVPVEEILQTDKIILLGNELKDTKEKVYSDSLVELIGWIVTEGCYQFDKNGKIKAITIYQNSGDYATRIEQCLKDEGLKYSVRLRKNNLCFYIFRDSCYDLYDLLPHKNLSMEIINNLTSSQRELLIQTMIDANGHRSGENNQYLRYTQKNKDHVDLFQILCILSGRRSSIKLCNHISYGKPTSYYSMNIFSKKKNITTGQCIDFHGGMNNGRDSVTRVIGRGKHLHPNKPTTYYKGMVWCPETEFGSFVARRNNTVYLTGNSYLEEMKGQALLQLSQVGLQFNEKHSSNPFSYYTAILSNSFTRILNIEKKNQNLRDDLLQAQGKTPSFSRQLEYDEAARKAREANESTQAESDE